MIDHALMRQIFVYIYLVMLCLALGCAAVAAYLRKNTELAQSLYAIAGTLIGLCSSLTCSNVSNGCAGE